MINHRLGPSSSSEKEASIGISSPIIQSRNDNQLFKSFDNTHFEKLLRLGEHLTESGTQFCELYDIFIIIQKQISEKLTRQTKSAALRARISVIRSRVNILRSKVNKQRSINCDLKNRLLTVEQEYDELQKNSLLLTNKCTSVSSRLASLQDAVTQVVQLCNLRKFYMISELVNIFPIEALCEQPRGNVSAPSDVRLTICKSLLIESDAPGTGSLPVAWIDTGDSLLPKAPTISTTNVFNPNSILVNDSIHLPDESFFLTDPTRSLRLANKPTTASVGLSHVVSFLIFLSSILDIRLRYPIRIFSRTCCLPTISDMIIMHLSNEERSFPLYLNRNVTLPDYRYAVYLLNQNITILRGFFGLSTPNQRATLWNLKNLVDSRLLRVDLRNRKSPVAIRLSGDLQNSANLEQNLE